MDKTWTDADARLLRELRVASGVDRATFARRCTLSLGQLTELEEGGNGRFYSDSIKAHTGRTLLAKLGHVRRVIEADRMDAPSASGVSAKPQAPTAPADPAPAPAPAAAASTSTSTTHAKPVEPAPAALRAAASLEPATDVAARPVSETPASSERSKAWIGLVVAGVAAIGVLAWWNRPQPAAPAAVAAAAPEPVVEVAAATATEASVVVAASAPAAVTAPASSAASASASANPIAPAAVAAASATASQARAGAAACPPAGGTPASFTPERALKPGSYVYFEAQKATVVCVTDAAQKKSEVRLKAGERTNVSGTPPFTVQAAQWADVRVFFQGVRVPLEDPGMSAGALLLQAR